MSFRYEEPKTLTATDMFIWWCKNKIKNKRHLKIKDANSNSRTTTLISKNSDELDWLRKHVLVLSEQIEKLEFKKVEIQNSESTRGKKDYLFGKCIEEIIVKRSDLYQSNSRIKHLEQVDSNTTQEIMSEKIFRNILYRFNELAKESMVNDGSVINMSHYLGYLYILKVDRTDLKFGSKSTRMPNWEASYEYRDELISEGIQPKDKDNPAGKNWIVYHTDDFYIRFAWAKKKGACRVKGHNYYSFTPTKGASGAKKYLVEMNKRNPVLHKNYSDKRIYKRKRRKLSER